MPVDPRYPGSGEPPYLYPNYRSTLERAPARAPLRQRYFVPGELTGPLSPARIAGARVGPSTADLTQQHPGGEPLGERIIVEGRVIDSSGRALPQVLVEVWQANASGRYAHEVDQHPAPLDPHFTGAGACLTDADGRYRFVTIKPGPYPWKNHPNAWRPSHIHFSLVGPSFSQRLITQMYFPGDPLLDHDPIYNSISDRILRASLVSRLDITRSVPEWALAYHFDVVLGGYEGIP